jgi:hypothetical protein
LRAIRARAPSEAASREKVEGSGTVEAEAAVTVKVTFVRDVMVKLPRLVLRLTQSAVEGSEASGVWAAMGD